MLKDEYFFFLIENISQICFSDPERIYNLAPPDKKYLSSVPFSKTK